jgi:hypothetical protein
VIEQAFFTLGEAAKATGKSKATISNAIKSGRLSVHEKTDKGYRIAAVELFRVFDSSPTNSAQNGSPTASRPEIEHITRGLEHELAIVREERERERRHFESTIDDLRRRLDAEAEERRRLTALLTDQRSMGRTSGPWWRRLIG